MLATFYGRGDRDRGPLSASRSTCIVRCVTQTQPASRKHVFKSRSRRGDCPERAKSWLHTFLPCASRSPGRSIRRQIAQGRDALCDGLLGWKTKACPTESHLEGPRAGRWALRCWEERKTADGSARNNVPDQHRRPGAHLVTQMRLFS